MNNEKIELIEKFIKFMKNNLGLMITLSGQNQDLEPMFAFINQQKNLFYEKHLENQSLKEKK